MERPVCRLLVGFAIAAAVSWGGAAEPVRETPTTRERVVSPRVAGMLGAAVPKYSPPPVPVAEPAEGAPAASRRIAAADRPVPANGIVRLPEYVVRERKPAKLPDPEEVMSPQQLERIAMQRHLGDEQGLERALSVLTPVHLWLKIPVLGKFPFRGFQTNEDRAMDLYWKAQKAERWEYLNSPEFKPTPPAPSSPRRDP